MDFGTGKWSLDFGSLKIVQKMLDKGNSVEIIADVLDASVEQVQE
jgi:hypothetical protein